MPWLLVWAWTLPRSWRAAPVAANGFSWERFCVVWAAFVFVFFSALGLEAAVVHPADVPGAGAGAGIRAHAPVGAGARVDRAAAGGRRAGAARRLRSWATTGWWRRSRRTSTPASIYAGVRPLARRRDRRVRRRRHRRVRAVPPRHARGEGAAASPRCRSRCCSACSSRSSATTPSPSCARRTVSCGTRSARTDGRSILRFPVYQVRSYDQTLPFYLRRPTTLVEYRDEMALGLDAEPDKGLARGRRGSSAWAAAPQALCADAGRTPPPSSAPKNVPMRVLARDPRRVFVARR